MNNKTIKNEKKFNKSEYDRQYHKTHYNNISLRLKPNDYNIIANYCNDNGISKTAYIIACCKYCIDNNIDVMWLYHNA